MKSGKGDLAWLGVTDSARQVIRDLTRDQGRQNGNDLLSPSVGFSALCGPELDVELAVFGWDEWGCDIFSSFDVVWRT